MDGDLDLDRALNKVNTQTPTSVRCTRFGDKEMEHFSHMKDFIMGTHLVKSWTSREKVIVIDLAVFFNMQRVLLSSGMIAGFGPYADQLYIMQYFIVEGVFKGQDNQILESCFKKISLVYEEYARSSSIKRLTIGNIDNDLIRKYFLKFGYEAITRDPHRDPFRMVYKNLL